VSIRTHGLAASALVAFALAATDTASARGTGVGAGADAHRTAVQPLTRPETHALLTSRRLWATIDVCNPTDQPDTVGVRGSMPGDGQARDRMYMSFRLQMETSLGHWRELSGSTTASFVAVGTGASSRQGGSSFVIKPVAGKPPIILRGVVVFQWRRGKTVLTQATRTTSAGHQAFAGADPEGFTAASCSLG
jgi:hypothetical protein